MPKIPPFKLMLDLSQHAVSSGYSNTPLIQALLVDGPHCTVGEPHAGYPSKPWTGSFPFTNTTAGMPTEEQLHDIKLQTLIHYISLFQ
jgi:hypothetical protein